MGLFSELRRRNVPRMAAFYLAAAWLVVQVAGALIDLRVLPEELGPWIMVTLAIGFPIALIVSWFWDITPEGIVRDTELSESGPPLAVSGRRTDFVIIAMLAAAVILLLVWEPPASGEDAITVLPFESMTGPEEALFSEGVSIELQTLLAQLRKFKVKLPPDKEILLRFSDVPTLAKEMNVRWVLKGSVRRAEQRVRISVQLIDADDDAAIRWSNVFDRELSAVNLFAIQTEIARKIASELRVVFDEPAEQRLATPPTQSTEAYSAYLLGRQRLTDGKVADMVDAIEQFALAIEFDRQFAGAYSGLADACFAYEHTSGGQSNQHCPSSPAGREQLARQALELDSESGEAWLSLGISIWEQAVRTLQSGSSEPLPKIREKLHEALAAFERGLELNPTLSQGYLWYGRNLLWIHVYPDPPSGWIKAWQAGRWESVFDKGLEADPLSISLHEAKTWYPVTVRSKEEAMWHGQRMIEIAPDSPLGYETAGEHEWVLNRRIDESIRWKHKAMQIDLKNPEFPLSIGRAYAALGDPDMALAFFDLAKTLTASDNPTGQHHLLLAQTVTRLVSGKSDPQEVAELLPVLTEFKSWDDSALWFANKVGVFVDLATGRPADALARIEAYMPRCLTAKDFFEKNLNCPSELVRVYQELGDPQSAQLLGDATVRRAQLWAEGFPAEWSLRGYASYLAAAGRTDEALDILEDLVSSGWRGDSYNKYPGFTLCCDVSFDSIRDDERFRAIVATFEADMAQQLENVRAMQRRGEVPTLEELNALIASAQESD